MQAYYYVDPRDGKIYSTAQDRGLSYEIKQQPCFKEIMRVNPKSGEVVEQVVAWNSHEELLSVIKSVI